MVKGSRVGLFVVGIAMVWASVAFAQVQDPREVQARRDCLTGNYESGTALLAKLFAETGSPNFVYNQARCYKQNARPDEAIQRFREYLRIAGDLGAEEKAEVERHIGECQAMQAQPERQPITPPTVPPTVPGPEGQAATPMAEPFPAFAPAVAPSAPASWAAAPSAPLPAGTTIPPGLAPAVAQVPPAPPENAGSGMRAFGIVIGAIGVGALVAGVVLSLEANHIATELNSDPTTYDRSKDNQGRLYGNLQWVGYGAGGACLLLGALLYYVGYQGPQTAAAGPTVSLLPAISGSQAGAALQGRF